MTLLFNIFLHKCHKSKHIELKTPKKYTEKILSPVGGFESYPKGQTLSS